MAANFPKGHFLKKIKLQNRRYRSMYTMKRHYLDQPVRDIQRTKRESEIPSY